MPLEGRGSLTFRADGSYQSRVFYSANNIFRASQEGLHVARTRDITWTSENDSWSVALSGTNLTDDEAG